MIANFILTCFVCHHRTFFPCSSFCVDEDRWILFCLLLVELCYVVQRNTRKNCENPTPEEAIGIIELISTFARLDDALRGAETLLNWFVRSKKMAACVGSLVVRCG